MNNQTLAGKRGYTEKRNFIRMKINTPAEVSVEQDSNVIKGICNDLSGSGMLLTLDQEPPSDNDLIVTICESDKSEPILKARCSIARTLTAEDDKHLIGLEIEEFMEEQNSSETRK